MKTKTYQTTYTCKGYTQTARLFAPNPSAALAMLRRNAPGAVQIESIISEGDQE